LKQIYLSISAHSFQTQNRFIPRNRLCGQEMRLVNITVILPDNKCDLVNSVNVVAYKSTQGFGYSEAQTALQK